jgi:hypothetical protein
MQEFRMQELNNREALRKAHTHTHTSSIQYPASSIQHPGILLLFINHCQTLSQKTLILDLLI